MARNIDDKTNKNDGPVEDNSTEANLRPKSGDRPLHNNAEKTLDADAGVKIPYTAGPVGMASDDPDADARNAVSDTDKELKRTIHNLSMDSDETTVGSGLRADAAAQTRGTQEGSSEKEKKDKRNREHMQYVLMLQQQLADLNNLIDGYNDQIGATNALMDIFDRDGKLDPTNSEHLRLLKAAGIPENQWGTITRDDLAKYKQDLIEKRDTAIDQKNGIEEKLGNQNRQIDKEYGEVPVNAAASHEERAVLISENAYNERQTGTAKAGDKAAEVEQQDQRITVLTLDEIKGLKGRPEYTQRLDQLIAGFDPKSIGKIIEDSGSDPDLRLRAQVSVFKKTFDLLDEIKHEPFYADEIQAELKKFPADIRATLCAEVNVPEKIKNEVLGTGTRRGTSFASTQDQEKNTAPLSDKFNAKSANMDIPMPDRELALTSETTIKNDLGIG